MSLFVRRERLVAPRDAVRGGPDVVRLAARHAVLGTWLTPPFPAGTETVLLGMGCFCAAEHRLWDLPGVWTTAVGYTGGYTRNPTHEQVSQNLTGHAEVVLVAYNPRRLQLGELLRRFWEDHDPTQGMRQGADIGTQYRSVLHWTTDRQRLAAEASRAAYQRELTRAGYPEITTDVRRAGPFFYADACHQQYVARHPNGFTGFGGTGVRC